MWASDKFLTCPAGNFVSQKIEEATREIVTVDLISINMDKLAGEVDVTCNWWENGHVVSSRWQSERSKLEATFKIQT